MVALELAMSRNSSDESDEPPTYGPDVGSMSLQSKFLILWREYVLKKKARLSNSQRQLFRHNMFDPQKAVESEFRFRSLNGDAQKVYTRVYLEHVARQGLYEKL